MAEIKPFRPLQYTVGNDRISEVVSPPYDIVGKEQRKALAEKSEYNIIRIELPEGEGSEKYAEAARLFEKYKADGVLKADDSDGLYVYSEDFIVKGKSYTVYGIICRVMLHDFSDKVILPHEETLTKAKQDRFDLMCATCANISPIYALYSDTTGSIDAVLRDKLAQPAIFSFTEGEGESFVRHSLRKIACPDEIEAITAAFGGLQLFIADGHHRYETALRYKKHLLEQGKLADTAADYQMILLVDMDNDGLVVFPTHRLVNPPVDMTTAELLAEISENFDVSEISGDAAAALESCGDKAGCFVMCCADDGDKKYLLQLRSLELMKKLLPDMSDAYSTLDVSILHTAILGGILGIDKENMALGKSLTYTRELSEALEAPSKGQCRLSFILNATKVHQIKDVSLAGEKMPQKSTYFYPKPITGLTINDLTVL